MAHSGLVTAARAGTEEKKGTPLTPHMEGILKQTDQILEKKYEVVTIVLSNPRNRSLTREEYNQLTEKLEKVAAEWKASISLADYKSQLPAELVDEDDRIVEKRFAEIQARGPQWNFQWKVDYKHVTLVSPYHIIFLAEQFQAKRIATEPKQLCFERLGDLDYKDADIDKLTLVLTNLPHCELEISLRHGPYLNKKWIAFFKTIINSTTRITKLTIWKERDDFLYEVIDELLSSLSRNTIKEFVFGLYISEFDGQLVKAIKSNSSLDTVKLIKATPTTADSVLSALSGHPNLAFLVITNTINFTSDPPPQPIHLTRLLKSKARIQFLWLNDSRYDIPSLATSLADNKTIESLCLTHCFSDAKEGEVLGKALAKHPCIKSLSIKTSGGSCDDAIRSLIDNLKPNQSLTYIDFYEGAFTKDRSPIETRNAIVKRNSDEEHEFYCGAALTLFQNTRQAKANPVLATKVIMHMIFSFLTPAKLAANPIRAKALLDLIEGNLKSQTWQKSITINGSVKFTFFQTRPRSVEVPTITHEEEQKREVKGLLPTPYRPA
jgi:hypothetical protein